MQTLLFAPLSLYGTADHFKVDAAERKCNLIRGLVVGAGQLHQTINE